MDIEEKLRGIKGKDGTNLYEHFANIIGKIVQDHPKNAYQIFEEYSHFIKQNNYNFTSNENYVDAYMLREKITEIQENLDKAAKYFVSFKNFANKKRDWQHQFKMQRARAKSKLSQVKSEPLLIC